MAKKKLLVIDDSETNLILIESMFENDPRVEVLLRKNGKAIVEYCIKEMPDLILLDLMMPEINGFEVLSLFHLSKQLKDIPVIVISALEDQENIKNAIELGAIDYIIKPIDYAENTRIILEKMGLN